MGNNLPVFDECGYLYGTVVFSRDGKKKRMVFRCRDGLNLDLSNVNRFVSQLKKMDIPQDEILKALKFFNEKMLGYGAC